MESVRKLDGNLLVKEVNYEIFEDHRITLSAFRMDGGSMMLWIGRQGSMKKSGTLSNLNLSINGSATNVIGNEDNTSLVNNLAIRISKKFNDNKPTYLSYNLTDAIFSTEKYAIKIEKSINDFLENYNC